MPEANGGWTVKAFQEGSSTRGGCLLGLHGILPVLQEKFELGAYPRCRATRSILSYSRELSGVE